MKTSETIEALAKAMAAAQKKLKNAPLNKTNPHFKSKYADLAGIRDATAPILAEHGLSISQFTTVDGETLVLCTRLLHESGQWMQGEYPLPMVLDKPQSMGSALTYARRYAWSAACGIAAEDDDDGNAAQNSGAKATAKQQEPKPDAHPDDLGATDYKAALRGFEVMRNSLLTALRGGEITPTDAEDRYREIREGAVHYEVNGKSKSVSTAALLRQCARSIEWRDDPKTDFPGFERRLRETREELDRAKTNGAPVDDPFAPDDQEAAE